MERAERIPDMKLVLRCSPAMSDWNGLPRSLSGIRNIMWSQSWMGSMSFSYTYLLSPTYCCRSWAAGLPWSKPWWPEDKPFSISLDFDEMP